MDHFNGEDNLKMSRIVNISETNTQVFYGATFIAKLSSRDLYRR